MKPSRPLEPDGCYRRTLSYRYLKIITPITNF
jgi:hypothetical protein